VNGGTVKPNGDRYRRALSTQSIARSCIEHVGHGANQASWLVGVVVVDMGQGTGLTKVGPA